METKDKQCTRTRRLSSRRFPFPCGSIWWFHPIRAPGMFSTLSKRPSNPGCTLKMEDATTNDGWEERSLAIAAMCGTWNKCPQNRLKYGPDGPQDTKPSNSPTRLSLLLLLLLLLVMVLLVTLPPPPPPPRKRLVSLRMRAQRRLTGRLKTWWKRLWNWRKPRRRSVKPWYKSWGTTMTLP